MDYPLPESNWVCRIIGHRYRAYVDRNGVNRKTCSLDGHTIPPFRKVNQHGFLPDDQQPEGAV